MKKPIPRITIQYARDRLEITLIYPNRTEKSFYIHDDSEERSKLKELLNVLGFECELL